MSDEPTAREARDRVLADARRMEDGTNRYLQNISVQSLPAGTDVPLAAAIRTVYLHGGSDQDGGDVQLGFAYSRCDQYVLWTDDQGFHSLIEYPTVAGAQRVCEREDRRQAGEDA